MQTVWKSSRLSGNFPACLEIFQTVPKYSIFFFLKIVFSWKIYLNSNYFVCIFMKNFPDGQCYHVTEVFSLCLAGPQAPSWTSSFWSSCSWTSNLWTLWLTADPIWAGPVRDRLVKGKPQITSNSNIDTFCENNFRAWFLWNHFEKSFKKH